MFRSLTKVVSTLALLAALLAPSQAGASLIQDILLNGTDVGDISFPGESGIDEDGSNFTFLFMGFSEVDITSVSWTLGDNWEVTSLSLDAFMGNDPCNKGQSPCENLELTLTAMDFMKDGIICLGTQPDADCIESSSGALISFNHDENGENGDPGPLPVPEPSTGALFGTGLVILWFMAWRRRRRNYSRVV